MIPNRPFVATYGASWGFRNFGDRLSGTILGEVMGLDFQEIDVSSLERPNAMLCIGSILQLAKSGDIVWGAGLNLPNIPQSFEGLDIFAVRGPLTAERIKQLGGPSVDCFGDPGILISSVASYREIWKKFKANHPDNSGIKASRFTVIPHYVHWQLLAKRIRIGLRLRGKKNLLIHRIGKQLATEKRQGYRFNYISIFENEKHLVRNIIESEVVISSSLHALITSIAFEVPISWWWPKLYDDLGDEQGRFKYYDFFASIGCREPKYTRQIGVPCEELLTLSVPEELTNKLKAAFNKIDRI